MTAPAIRPARPALVVAHRGASALRPEHTLAAYALAIEQGADYVEPDLVATRDGILVARHENEIGGSTDVAEHPEFADRETVKRVDGEAQRGWFTEDFDLAELRTLRARERLPQLRSTEFDGQFAIPTFDEIIELVAAESARLGRVIGLAPELKHPTHFRELGLALEPKLLEALRRHEYTLTAPVLVQSFETGNLAALRATLGEDFPKVSLLQLYGSRHERPWDLAATGQRTTYGDLLEPSGLREIAAHADAIGVPVELLQPEDGRSVLVEAAHEAGLDVFAYTFRPENHFLPHPHRGGGDKAQRNEAGAVAHIRAALALGIDGFFSDDSALGRRAVDR